MSNFSQDAVQGQPTKGRRTNLLVDGHREEPGDAADAAEHGQHAADVPDDVQVSAHRRRGQRHAEGEVNLQATEPNNHD